MASLDGRPLSNTNLVNDLRDDDQLSLVRPSEPLPQDQNAHISGGRMKELLGGGTAPGNPAPAMNLYMGPGTHIDGPMSQKAATDYANRGPNTASGSAYHVVRYARITDPRWTSGISTLDSLQASGVVGLEDRARVVDPLPGDPKEYVFVYTPGTLNCWRDGDRVERSSGQWVDASSPAALAVNVPVYDPTFNSTGTPPGYPIGFEVRYTPTGGVEGHYVADVAGQLAAPGATAGQWHQVAPSLAPSPLFARLSLGDAQSQATRGTLVAGREYGITGRTAGAPDVRGTFSAFAPAFMQYAVLEGRSGAYSYDLTSDTATLLPPPIDYLNEITPPANALLSGAGSKSYVLNGVSINLFDSTDQPAGARFYGRLFAFRSVGTTPSSIGTGTTTSGIDGASSLTLQPGEWIVIKSDFAAGGYTKVMRGSLNPPPPPNPAAAGDYVLRISSTGAASYVLVGSTAPTPAPAPTISNASFTAA